MERVGGAPVRVFNSNALHWDGNKLCLGRRQVVRIVEDQKYSGVMWRVEMPDGTLSDMVNRTRAKDAAMSIALRILNTKESRTEAAPVS